MTGRPEVCAAAIDLQRLVIVRPLQWNHHNWPKDIVSEGLQPGSIIRGRIRSTQDRHGFPHETKGRQILPPFVPFTRALSDVGVIVRSGRYDAPPSRDVRPTEANAEALTVSKLQRYRNVADGAPSMTMRESSRLVARTPHSITDPAVLENDLVRVERDRMAIDREDLIVGVVCVAAPVFRDNIAVAAVSVTGPKAWIGPLRIARAVRTAARGISRRLPRASDRPSPHRA
jgi:Bacterial transcriptional regulator